MKMESRSQRREMLFFLATNLASVTSRANQYKEVLVSGALLFSALQHVIRSARNTNSNIALLPSHFIPIDHVILFLYHLFVSSSVTLSPCHGTPQKVTKKRDQPKTLLGRSLVITV